jgi:hypothetical protein
MKTAFNSPALTGFWLLCCVVGWAPRAYAVAGVADTTIIADDLTDLWKWPRELRQWTLLIQTVNEQVQKTEELIRITGNAQEVAGKSIGSVPVLLRSIDPVFEVKTTQEILDLSETAYGLNSPVRKVNLEANKITASFEAFGRTFRRNDEHYAGYARQEAMYDRYRRTVAAAESVDTAEMNLQKRVLEQLSKAKTATEVNLLHAQIDASKQRQDLAHQRSQQAKGDLDAFNGQLVVENARKAEADREWAQTVVEEMRNKALAAYRRQVGLPENIETTR